MEWISINDRLPENDTECIVWVEENGCEYFSEAVFNSEYFGQKNNQFVHYENAGEYENNLTKYVTHWMVPKSPYA